MFISATVLLLDIIKIHINTWPNSKAVTLASKDVLNLHLFFQLLI